MSDKWQAQDQFWNSFGIPAYDVNSVPEDVVMPYITYTAVVSGFEKVVLLNASIWYSSTSWAAISQKADEIAQAVKDYKLILLDDHQYMFLTQGSPFAQRMPDAQDRVKRIYINIMCEYFTRY